MNLTLGVTLYGKDRTGNPDANTANWVIDSGLKKTLTVKAANDASCGKLW